MDAKSRGQALLHDAVTPRMRASELARELDVSPQAVSAWLRGDAKPDPEKMAKLEDLLGIPMRAWLEADESGDLPPVAATGTDRSTG